MSASRKQVPRMTQAQFLAWDAPGPQRWQLRNGQPVAMAPASEIHGALQAELAALLRNHLLQAGSTCRVVTAPGVVPPAHESMNYRIPDLGITCAPPREGLIMQEPLLLIEILSPSNEAETRANVQAYTTIPGLQDMLAVSSTRIQAELLRRGPDGSWPAAPRIIHRGATLDLASIGFSAPLTTLYRTTGLA